MTLSLENGGGESFLGPVDEEAARQYESALTHKVRALMYEEFADPPVGYLPDDNRFHHMDGEAVIVSELTGDESYLDVGGGDGAYVELLAKVCGLQGEIVCLNNEANHYVTLEKELADNENVRFLEGDARQLPFEDESFDRVSIKNVLYHLDSPETAIDEAVRVLKPGGLLIIATRNPGNQGKMWCAMDDITEELQTMSRLGQTEPLRVLPNGKPIGRSDYSTTKPPEVFYRRFDMDRVRAEMQKRGLAVRSEFLQSSFHDDETRRSNMYLPLVTALRPPRHLYETAWSIYELSALSLRTAFRGEIPRGLDMLRAIERVLKPRFEAEVYRNGYYLEHLSQYVAAFEKPLRANPKLLGATALK